MKQRTDEWLNARLGIVTASRVSDVMAKTKTGPAAVRQNYMAQLIIEALTGKPVEQYTNGAMLWGIEQEPSAKAVYEIANDVMVEDVGFITANLGNGLLGASPDGLIGTDGLVEIKCPNSATHLNTLLTGEIKGEYIWQMQCQMYVMARKWCDFVSFDPRFPEEHQVFQKRIERDEKAITKMLEEVGTFYQEMTNAIIKLNHRKIKQ